MVYKVSVTNLKKHNQNQPTISNHNIPPKLFTPLFLSLFHMTKEQIQDLRDRLASLRRHL